MTLNDPIYRKLQQHLDSQAVGFPETRKGSEIAILKHIFTPQQAKIACYLNYRPEPIETIYERFTDQVGSIEALSDILDVIEKNGGIEVKIRDGIKLYCNAPLIVGMFEFQGNRLTPEFIKDFERYTNSQKFGIEYISTDLPQMRTIPIEKSISVQSEVSTFDEVRTLLKDSSGLFAIVPCICRKKKKINGETCKITDREETCLAIGEMADSAIRINMGRQIDMEEAISILEQNQKEGMVFQPSNTESADFICSCCGCCCGMLGMHKNLPKPVDFWASNFYARVDTDSCKGCGNCKKKCQVEAVRLSEPDSTVHINLDRCLGCGLCIPACPAKAITLEKKTNEVRPPKDRDELQEILMTRKKGRFGKLKVTGKVVVDAVLTGQTHLLK